MVLVHTPETDSLPKTPNRPLVPISRHSEDPVLLPGKATAPPLGPHHRELHCKNVNKALPQSVGVVLTELRHLRRWQIAEDVVCPGPGAHQEEQPCAL